MSIYPSFEAYWQTQRNALSALESIEAEEEAEPFALLNTKPVIPTGGNFQSVIIENSGDLLKDKYEDSLNQILASK